LNSKTQDLLFLKATDATKVLDSLLEEEKEATENFKKKKESVDSLLQEAKKARDQTR